MARPSVSTKQLNSAANKRKHSRGVDKDSLRRAQLEKRAIMWDIQHAAQGKYDNFLRSPACHACENDNNIKTSLGQNEGADSNCIHQLRSGNEARHHYGATLVVPLQKRCKLQGCPPPMIKNFYCCEKQDKTYWVDSELTT